ncbi:MAG TPA: hypothetical protein VJP02_21835 [Candidatus Sulfotelmatobacter sp.]|nr:hypothetical protein [Candidatus Sulfotelmatobacter sp.]
MKSWVLTVTAAVLDELDRQDRELHADLYGEFGEGRIASFEMAKGKLTWFNFRDDACSKADYPMRLKNEFPDGERHTVWIREKSWDIDGRSRVASSA